jgi:hypothetical protein
MNASDRITELRNFVVDRMSIEELALVRSDLKRLGAEFTESAVATPEWIGEQIKAVTLEIGRRTEDDLQKRLKEIRSQRSGLETNTEKRDRLAREEAEVLAKLGKGEPQAV